MQLTSGDQVFNGLLMVKTAIKISGHLSQQKKNVIDR